MIDVNYSYIQRRLFLQSWDRVVIDVVAAVWAASVLESRPRVTIVVEGIPQKVRNPNEEPTCGHKLVGFRRRLGEVRVQAPGRPPIFAFTFLGFFIGFHAVGVTSCGNGFKLA